MVFVRENPIKMDDWGPYDSGNYHIACSVCDKAAFSVSSHTKWKVFVTGFDPVHNIIESSEVYDIHNQVKTCSGESEENRPQMNQDR